MKFNHLTVAEIGMLEEPFSIEEVKEVIWNSGSEKSPGPDDFNMGFFKKRREIVKADLISCILEFHLNATLPKVITTIFIDLIPKRVIHKF